MGATSSKSPRSILGPSNHVVSVPRLPQELFDEIINHLGDDATSLRRCSIAAKSFVPSCRRHLFRRVVFRPQNLPAWKATFPDPLTSPAQYAREMRLHLSSETPIRLAEYMRCFSNVRDLTLIGGRCENHQWIRCLGELPTSIRSLTMKFASITNGQVLEIMEQLPYLDDISLSTFKGTDLTPDAGEILKGRYGGKLDLLLMDDFHAGIVRSLLKAPDGLGFKSVKALCNTEDDFMVYVDLVAACRDTLVDLDISVSSEAIIIPTKTAQTFDFLHHKSLEHLSFSLLSNFASCRWLSMALSTINPTNSPRLSTITIYLHRHVAPARVISETPLDDIVVKDLRDVGSEIKRIGTESGGTIKFEIVIPLPWVMQPLRSVWPDVLDGCSLKTQY